MSKKILIISPTPTHPPNAGNRQGILSLANNLKLQGFECYFILLEYETADKQQMQNWWGNKIFYFNRESLFGEKSLFQRVKQKLFRLIRTSKKNIGLISRKYSSDEIAFNSFLDENYPHNLTSFLIRLQNQYQFEAVIVTYVFLSKAFLAFNKNVLKILDTHDIFSHRFRRFLEIGQTPAWISLFPAEEKKGFDRADIILSVQQHEIAFIKKLGVKKKILQIGHSLIYNPAYARNNDTL